MPNLSSDCVWWYCVERKRWHVSAPSNNGPEALNGLRASFIAGGNYAEVGHKAAMPDSPPTPEDFEHCGLSREGEKLS